MKLSIGKAWEESSAFLGREARLVAPVALATFALPAVLISWTYPAGAHGAAAAAAMASLFAKLILWMLGMMTVALLAIGWHGSVREALLKALRRVLSPLGAVILVLLPIFLVAIIGFGVALVGAGISDPATMTPQALAAVPNVRWITLALVVLIIFAAVRLFPLPAIAASESVGSIRLLRRSWTMTKGQSVRLLVLILLLVFSMIVLGMAVGTVVASMATLAIGEVRPFSLSALMVALASGFVSALVWSVSASMVGRVYVQLAGNKV